MGSYPLAGRNAGRLRALLRLSLAMALAFAVIAAAASTASAASANVALVPSGSGEAGNGGTFPESGFPNSYAPTFTALDPVTIRDAASDPLTAFDTVVLVQLCSINDFLSNTQFANRLHGFVQRGGKLLIWDSECEQTDYSKFVFPFQTSNPGAAGAQGTLTDAEDNILSSTDPNSNAYIDLDKVSTDTDAVGDANVFTSFDQNYCVDMRATNILGVNGPVQAYARYGSGLIIYDGLDMDYLERDGMDFGTADGANNLARIWMFNLLVPNDGSGLPCGVKVFGITLDPKTASNPLNTSHTVTATVFANGEPQPGVTVSFEVIDGPHKGVTGSATTDANGKATFTYTGTIAGTDTIQASATLSQSAPPQQSQQQALSKGTAQTSTVTETATKEWLAPPPPPAPPPLAGALPARARSGTARLYSRRGCVRGSFTAQVAGRSISSVRFRLNGRSLGVVRRRGSDRRYSVRVPVRSLRVGRHTLTATVTFVRSSETRSRRLTQRFQVCAAQVEPQFTG